jgi:hypothetical protein
MGQISIVQCCVPSHCWLVSISRPSSTRRDTTGCDLHMDGWASWAETNAIRSVIVPYRLNKSRNVLWGRRQTWSSLTAWTNGFCFLVSITDFSTKLNKLKTKLRGLSPLANYTDQSSATCRWCKCQVFRIEGAAWSVRRILNGCILGFLDRSRFYFFQLAPQLNSRGWADTVRGPLLLRISGRAGNRTRTVAVSV